MRNNYLFSEYQVFDVIEAQTTAIDKEVDSIESNRLLNTSTSDLADYLSEKLTLDVPIIQKDNIAASQKETKIDVSDDPRRAIFSRDRPYLITGTEIKIEIPFDGDKDFFHIRPSTYSLSPPDGLITGNMLILQFSETDIQPDRLKSNIDHQLAEIDRWLSYLKTDVEKFNASLKGLITAKIEGRKRKILTNQNLVSSLGFKLKENPNSPQTYMAPNVKRKISPSFPKATNQAYTPEPVLSKEDYEHILRVIDNMAHVMERSPSAFINMDEESLRTHFLVQLNGHYEGQATGETFNYNGKTDILIRSNDKNIFIAECKFWKGEKKYLETIDQILGYTSWRDTKVAIIVFNKNKDLSIVIKAISEVTKTHENFKKELSTPNGEETELRYIFSNKDDKNREMYLTVKIYDIPQ